MKELDLEGVLYILGCARVNRLPVGSGSTRCHRAKACLHSICGADPHRTLHLSVVPVSGLGQQKGL
jgi:hypothetical protein